MPAEHLPAPTAIQANDVITMNGSPDRNRRGSLDDGFCCRFTEATESLMDGRDQSGELIRRDLIASNIRADDHRDEFGRLLIGHRLVPLFPTGNNIPTPVNSGRRFRISIGYHAALLPPFWFRPPLDEDPHPPFPGKSHLGGRTGNSTAAVLRALNMVKVCPDSLDLLRRDRIGEALRGEGIFAPIRRFGIGIH
jgi:hypothetical protein